MATANDLNISQSGIVAFDGIATFSGRTLTAGTGISISNGDGVAGDPVINATGGGGGVAGTESFFAYLSATTGFITGDGTTVTAPFDTIYFDNGSNFDTTNHWYVVPVTGIYQFNVNAIFQNGSGTNTGVYLELMNGAQTYFLGYNAPFNNATVPGNGTGNASTIIPCTAGDQIFLNIAVNGNVTPNVGMSGSNVAFSSFSGYRVA